MENIESFVRYYCGYLTKEQESVMLPLIKDGRVIGVAKAIGCIVLCPLVDFGKYPLNVINTDGYFHLIDPGSVKFYQGKDNEN